MPSLRLRETDASGRTMSSLLDLLRDWSSIERLSCPNDRRKARLPVIWCDARRHPSSSSSSPSRTMSPGCLLISTTRRLFLANLLVVSVYLPIVLFHNWMFFWGDAPDVRDWHPFRRGHDEAGRDFILAPCGRAWTYRPTRVLRFWDRSWRFYAKASHHQPAYEDGESAELTGVIQAAMATIDDEGIFSPPLPDEPPRHA